MDTCKLIQVIETTLTRRGNGREDDPFRVITEYWSTDGKLLAQVDPYVPGRTGHRWTFDDGSGGPA